MVQVGEHRYPLGPGQAFLIYPEILTYYEADSSTPWAYTWVAFDGEQAAAILARTRLTPDKPIFQMDLRIMPALYEKLTLAASQNQGADLLLKSLLYEFLSVLIQMVQKSESSIPASKKQDAYIVQSLEFIHAHYHEPITIRQLAAHLGLDRKYISVLFKESLGIPPQQYLVQYRIEKACELLQKRQYSIGEVARSVGYQDSLLFSKMFKKHRGVAPKYYE